MHNWTRERWGALTLHLAFMVVPLGVSTVSAFLFWQSWFNSPWPAALIVGIVEVLALTGLITQIAHVQWPLKGLRHLLPFISIIPIGYEIYLLLKPNGLGGALTITTGLTLWLSYLARVLYISFEGLFISPVEAARESAQRDVGRLAISLAQFGELQEAVHGFADVVNASRRMLDSPMPAQLFPQVIPEVQQPQQLQIGDDLGDPDKYLCMKCGASQFAAGRDPVKMRAASARLGCLNCRGS